MDAVYFPAGSSSAAPDAALCLFRNSCPESGKRIDVDTLPLEIQFQGGPRFEWLPDNRHIRYEYQARGMKSIEIRLIDADTGKQQTLLREESQQYVDPGETFFRFDAATNEILWTSERDGWNHLYLATASGQLENRITRGDWVVRGIAYVDDKNRRVYFLASGREPNEDPYQIHLYVVNFDGSGLNCYRRKMPTILSAFRPTAPFSWTAIRARTPLAKAFCAAQWMEARCGFSKRPISPDC